jgi:malonate transporter MadM subunit
VLMHTRRRQVPPWRLVLEEGPTVTISGVALLSICTFLGVLLGVLVAAAFGYTDAVSLTMIGTGAVTYIVGPVTGAALGAPSPVIALSIATGVFKAVIVMIGTPFVAKMIGLNNPRSAMVFGGLMGRSAGFREGWLQPTGAWCRTMP